ncbi:hypothetical protein GUJ93_ZPchr0006g45664 [Zizania palustris]|uniref:Uncharacterized protein n=1 Tax=Zizania palustris TaxID=103762 RepID=A0A8J5T727_ZIZPA|nr:hypothetical protein GUJ93_ZPchr0006g45664 [Zizania palustris]
MEIFFKVDEVVRRGDNNNPNPNSDDLDEEDDLEFEEHNNEEVHMEEASNDKTTTPDTNKDIDCAEDTNHTAYGKVVPNEEEIVEATIDLSVNILLEEISFMVTADKDDAGCRIDVPTRGG